MISPVVLASDFPTYLDFRETVDLPNMYRVWVLSNIRFWYAAIWKTFSIEVSANDPLNVVSIRVVFFNFYGWRTRDKKTHLRRHL